MRLWGNAKLGDRRADAIRLIRLRIPVPTQQRLRRSDLHHYKAGPFQMLDKALADDLRHILSALWTRLRPWKRSA